MFLPPQKRSHECASRVRSTYIFCLFTPSTNRKCLSERHVIFIDKSYVTRLLQTVIEGSYSSLFPTSLREDKLLRSESEGRSRPHPVISVTPECIHSCQLEIRTSNLKMASTEIFDAAVVVQFLAADRQELFMNKKR